MLPLSDWPMQARSKLVGVFTDIDDTLTTQGSITPDALQALAALQTAGLMVIAITGRPIGWCTPFALGDGEKSIAPWPVDAMVAENGGVAFAPDIGHENSLQPPCNKREQLSKLYQQDAATRSASALRMRQVATQVLQAVPGVQLTRDHAGRETDLAFDYNEFAHLPPDVVAQVVGLLQRAGMHTTVSSIHIHGCFSSFTKWTGARWIVQHLFGRDLQNELDQWVFVGDSGNDQAMFEHFTHSVGVANIRHVEAALTHLPRYITPSARGAGFAQVAQAVLQARAA